MFAVYFLCLFSIVLGHAHVNNGNNNSLVISTTSGAFEGLIDGSTPKVRQWRAIPFALPPVGTNRWLPPQKIMNPDRSRVQDATNFPPSCSQYLGSGPTLWSLIVPQWIIYTIGQNKTAGAYAWSTAEDCLYLGVWAPTKAKTKLPVVMFMTGGAFGAGGVNIPYQIPSQWVERSQSHIVVTINYRLSIMGFPGARGLSDVNLGILDQRAALEWVRDNAEAFGGDPNRITLWGQSAGAISSEIHSFYKYQDPIAQAYIMTSGTLGSGFTQPDTHGGNFSLVASRLGCGNTTSPAAELACMRKVPVDQVVTTASTTKGARFLPIQDNKTVFTNYTDLYEKGLFAQKPAIYSHCANDGTGVLPLPPNRNNVNTTQEHIALLESFICPQKNSSRLRSKFNKYVYQYESSANFSNVSPEPWLGAYHDSDLAYIFGTHANYRGLSTDYEFEVAHAFQDKLLAFIQDPTSVPGWPTWEEGNILRIGAPGGPAVQLVPRSEVDGSCL